MKRNLIMSSTIIFILVSLFFIYSINPSVAYYNFDGFEITWMAYGKVHGDLYVAGGHGLDATPYEELFPIPDGNEILWAEVLIGIWGGNEYNTGWIQTHVNSTSLGTQNINGINDQNSNILGAAHGAYLAFYNVTSHVELNKTLNVTVQTGGTIDGRIYGITLFVLFNNSNNIIKFCIGYGNTGLHYLTQGSINDESTFTLKDQYNQTEFQNATLHVSYTGSNSGQLDYLYFNENLLSSDAGNEESGSYFDLDSYDVLSYLNESNIVRFHRGDESYLHPTLTILKATYKAGFGEGEDDYVYYNIGGDGPFSGGFPFEIIFLVIMTSVIISSAIALFSLQYYMKRKKK